MERNHPSRRISPTTVRRISASVRASSSPTDSVPAGGIDCFSFRSTRSRVVSTSRSRRLLGRGIQLREAVSVCTTRLLRIRGSRRRLLVYLTSCSDRLGRLERRLTVTRRRQGSVNLRAIRAGSSIQLARLGNDPRKNRLNKRVGLPTKRLCQGPPRTSRAARDIRSGLASPIAVQFNTFLRSAGPSAGAFSIWWDVTRLYVCVVCLLRIHNLNLHI